VAATYNQYGMLNYFKLTNPPFPAQSNLSISTGGLGLSHAQKQVDILLIYSFFSLR
jgi:hypothetical protein